MERICNSHYPVWAKATEQEQKQFALFIDERIEFYSVIYINARCFWSRARKRENRAKWCRQTTFKYFECIWIEILMMLMMTLRHT